MIWTRGSVKRLCFVTACVLMKCDKVKVPSQGCAKVVVGTWCENCLPEIFCLKPANSNHSVGLTVKWCLCSRFIVVNLFYENKFSFA